MLVDVDLPIFSAVQTISGPEGHATKIMLDKPEVSEETMSRNNQLNDDSEMENGEYFPTQLFIQSIIHRKLELSYHWAISCTTCSRRHQFRFQKLELSSPGNDFGIGRQACYQQGMAGQPRI